MLHEFLSLFPHNNYLTALFCFICYFLWINACRCRFKIWTFYNYVRWCMSLYTYCTNTSLFYHASNTWIAKWLFMMKQILDFRVFFKLHQQKLLTGDFVMLEEKVFHTQSFIHSDLTSLESGSHYSVLYFYCEENWRFL